MTREAVRDQLRLVTESVFDEWTGGFRPSRAAGWGFIPSPVDAGARFFLGGRLTKEFTRHRAGYERGLKAALDYAEEVAVDGGSFGKYEGEILETDYWYECCDEGCDKLGDALLDRYRQIGKDLGPIVGFPEDEFWEAAKGAYDKNKTVEALNHVFGYADILEEHADCVALEMTVASRNVDYTDEALRSLRSAEERLFERVEAKADDVY